MNNPGDYSDYSRQDLLDVLKHIDKQQYPERYAAAVSELNKRESEQPDDLSAKVKISPYSEKTPPQHKLKVIIVFGLFIFMLGGALLHMYNAGFVTSQRWQSTVVLQIVVYGIVICALWVKAILNDNWFSRNLMRQGIRGKMAMVFAPFGLLMIMGSFVVYVLPQMIHPLTPLYAFDYESVYHRSYSEKGCHYQVKVAASEALTSATLCIDYAMYRKLPEQGRVRLFGQLSWFGLDVSRMAFN